MSMRKALVLFAALVVLVSCCFFAAHAAVNSQKEQVTWQEQTLYGDKAAVEGLRVTTQNSLDSSLLWNTTGVLGEALDPETDFSFSNQNHDSSYPVSYRGIDLFMNYTLYGLESTDWLNDDTKEQVTRIQAFYDECWEATPEGTEKSYTMDVTEYLDYYLLDGWFDLPGYTTGGWSDRNKDPVLAEAGRVFNDYFKIPILGKYEMDFTIDKNHDNVSSASGIENDYAPEFSGVVVGDTCYFTFSTVAFEGVYADCSLIPGGYGIYSFTYSAEGDPKVDLSSLSTVYSLDPTEMYQGLSVSADERQLLLHTRDEESIYLTVIDIATMTCLQKLELAKADDGYYYWPRVEDEFIATVRYRYEPETEPLLIFHVRQNDGTFRHVFTVPLNTAEFNMWQVLEYRGLDDCKLAYNGEYLVIAQNAFRSEEEKGYYADTCDFYIAAYAQAGMAYAGQYHVSLTEVNDSNMAFPCTPFGYCPLRIAWEES